MLLLGKDQLLVQRSDNDKDGLKIKQELAKYCWFKDRIRIDLVDILLRLCNRRFKARWKRYGMIGYQVKRSAGRLAAAGKDRLKKNN